MRGVLSTAMLAALTAIAALPLACGSSDDDPREGSTAPPSAVDAGSDRAPDAPPDATPLVDVTRFGAKGDGMTDDTKALADAANASSALFFPAGVYLVDTLKLLPGTHVVAAPGAILRGRPSATVMPVLTLTSGIRIEGLAIDGNKAVRGGSCVFARGAANLALSKVFVHDCKMAGVTLGNSDDYVIEESRFERCEAQCIDLGFSSRGSVTKNTVSDCAHGIQWWGGDSAVTSTAGIFDIAITGNTVKNVKGGCIWGSDGDRITVTGNTVESCHDVGIDLEGTSHSTVKDNTVKDAGNGGLATFFGASDDTFINNTVVQTGTGPGIKLFGPLPSARLTFTGNKIQTANAIGITMDQGFVSELLLQNNVVVASGGQAAIRVLDAAQVTIKGNQLTVSGATGIAFEGTSDSFLTSNVIHTTGDPTASPGDHGGVFIPWRSSAFPAKRNSVSQNKVSGFSTAINDDCWGDLASANTITQNGVDGAIYRRAGAGWTGTIANNYLLTNPNIPVDAQTY